MTGFVQRDGVVTELELDITPAHAALDDARATAMVFRALITRARAKLGFETVGDVVSVLPRPVVDRTPRPERPRPLRIRTRYRAAFATDPLAIGYFQNVNPTVSNRQSSSGQSRLKSYTKV